MLGLPAWLVSTVKLSDRDIFRVITYSLFINILALATPIFVLQVYDRVVFQSGLDTLKALIFGVLIALLFDFFLRQARSRLLQFISLKIDGRLGKEIFDRFSQLNLNQLESRPSSYWQNIFRDLAHIRNFVGGATIILFIDIPFSIIFILIIYLIAPPLIWVFLGTILAFSLLAWSSSKFVKKAALQEQNVRSGVENLLVEIVSNRITVKSLDIGRYLQLIWSERHSESIQKAVSRGRIADRYANINVVLTMGVTVALTSFGAVAVLDQTMTIGGLIAANMLATRVIQPLSQLSIAWRTLNQFRSSRDRVRDLYLESGHVNTTPVEFDRPKGEIQIDKLNFSYDDEKRVLEDITLSFRPGEIHAVVGNNGSGKSTLFKLVLNLYKPQAGRILWDEADIRQFDHSQLSSWYGYVPQDCTLFTGSIRDNIASFSDEIPDREVIGIAQELGLHADISDLPNGYSTLIGEGGYSLSVGQRQKIAIARALIGSPVVMLLDEPTSNLDQSSEKMMIDFLGRRAKEYRSTIIVVTHSPAILAMVDQITVLNKGRIYLTGDRESVLPKITKSPRR
ncbi:MAG: Leukotoxin export ATP-binding protein LtxB [Alphaproteobacteria bacterium MarineAlpha11_Bin1]|nr:MAG: Leukotoxin export ATP-binding protein LtxB [Alphaproteobacteria bacterium MarineAlpha11_Bin1]|tara:strand:+ start:2050 stop:3750 length:1701 start_codon:yes stop_codon:yes gene_type:complete